MSTTTESRHAASRRRITHLAYAVARDEGLWRPLVKFDRERRWYHRLHAADDHEAWLLTWWPGQGTGLHDHGGASGAFVVVQGQLEERSGSLGHRSLRTRSLRAVTGRAFGPRYLHDVTNEGNVPAVSVHVYVSRLAVMNRYEMGPDGPIHVGVDEERSW